MHWFSFIPVFNPVNMRAYYERAASLTGTKPHSQSLVGEDGKGTEKLL